MTRIDKPLRRPAVVERNGDLWLVRRIPKVCLGPVEKYSIHTPDRIVIRPKRKRK